MIPSTEGDSYDNNRWATSCAIVNPRTSWNETTSSLDLSLKSPYLPVLFTAAGIPGAAGRMFWMFSSSQ